jgi:predicted permease
LAGIATERIRVLPGTNALSNLQRTFTQPLWVLMALVAMVLMIACGNVAALLISRAVARRKEIALRTALGASGTRVVRALIVESVSLSGLGTMIGVAGAYWGVDALIALLPADRFVLVIQPNWTVLAFSAGVSLLVGVLLGVFPAAQVLRLDLRSILGSEGAGVTSGGNRFGLRQALVLAQVAFSVVVLVGAGLFVRSLVALQRTDSGVRVEQILQLTLDPVAAGYPPQQAVQAYERIHEAVVALPQVSSAAFAMIPLLADQLVANAFYPPGFVPRPGTADTSSFDGVSPGLFKTLGIPLLKGREFTDRDDAKAPRVVIINATMARRFFGDQDPIGRQLVEGGGAASEIVGVVEDTKFANMREQPQRIVFLPFRQFGPPGVSRTLYVRAASDPLALAASVRAAVRGVDRNIPVYGVKTVAQQVSETLVQERLTATLSTWFGGLALFLAALGLYGLFHYSVQRRWREFSLRVALGAAPRAIVHLVFREALMLVTVGVIAGLVMAVLLARYVVPLLFDARPTDTGVLLLTAALMGATAIAAGAVPAWRAARANPIQSLRS